MYDIEMQEMTPAFLDCWREAGMHLDRQVDVGIKFWLRAHPYPPFLEHLSFRLGNQIFLVRVEDVDNTVRGPGSLQGLLAAADAASGYPCTLPMRKQVLGNRWVADRPGWGLVDPITNIPVDPFTLVTDDKIEMTSWELQDFAVQIVRDHLDQKGFRLMSWQGNPEVDPSIWFVGKSGNPEWVVVRAAPFPQQRAEVPMTWAAIAEKCSKLSPLGHFASVAIASDDQPFDSDDAAPMPLWRGYCMYVNFAGLESAK